jgi:thiol-disulfide isomerase/thioredoxin
MKALLLFLSLLTTTLAQAGDIRNIEQFDLNYYKGKVVYLDFWASWCKPCQKSFPWMNALMKKYPADQFQVVTINLDADAKDMKTFLEHVPADFTVFHDPSGQVAERFKLPGMPTSFIIDKNGKASSKHIGFFQSKIQEIEAEIEALL